MGARLVSLALQPDWAVLSPRARLVLITMCQRSLDKRSDNGHPPRTYWAGHDGLASQVYGRCDDSALRQVRKAIQELEQAGAIETLTVAIGRAGKSSYLLTPENWPQQPMLDGKMGVCVPPSPPSPPS